jgi:ABC-type transporter Mla maintaining outer membrane lipid asymmetry ATPase subunit MlaF
VSPERADRPPLPPPPDFAAPADAALLVDRLTGPAGTPVLRDISLAVPRGATHVVLGAMHSGKSLLLRLLLGLQRSQHGTVVIDGVSFDAAAPDENTLRRARRSVGIVFDSSALVSRLTLLENVELPLVEHTAMEASAARDAAAELLREVGVRSNMDRTPDAVSRLDRRRAALARALALAPMLLLIDEPGHGLDADAAAGLDDTLAELQRRRGCAMLICSQEVRYAFRAPHAVSVLAGGTIVEHGTLDALRASQRTAVRRLVDRRGAA